MTPTLIGAFEVAALELELPLHPALSRPSAATAAMAAVARSLIGIWLFPLLIGSASV
jgi:hypothetical protein